MGGPAREDEDVVARALALELERTAGARLHDEHGARLGRLGADELGGGQGADLLIAGDEDRQAFETRLAEVVAQDRGRVHTHDRPGEHVEAARPAQDAVVGGEGDALERSVRPHRVLVVEEDDAGRAGPEAQAQMSGALDLEQLGFGSEALTQQCGEVACTGGDGFSVARRSLGRDHALDIGEDVGQTLGGLSYEVGGLQVGRCR